MEVSITDFIPGTFSDETLDLFKTNDGETYATVNGVTRKINDSGFKDFIGRNFFMRLADFLPKSKMKNVIEKCDNFARYFGENKQIHHRFAKVDGTIYIDLCNPKFEVIEITGDSVKVITNPPVKFVRSKIQQEINIPNPKAVVRDLRRLENYIPFKTDDDFTLFVAWLLSCMNTDGGYPPLFLTGEHGSAKSTTTEFIKDLLDPSSIPLRNLPKNMQEMMIACINEFIPCFDNISKISDKQSDNLCKVSTGAGFATRKLYTNMEEVQCSCKRPTVTNTISFVPTRQDLLDRAIIVHLDFIKPENRKTSRELQESWGEDRPFIFGALCNAVSACLRNYNQVQADNLPRMADFAKWVMAAEEMLPWDEGTFINTLQNSRSRLVDEAIDADPVAMAVLKLMNTRDEWEGSASKLLNLLGEIAGQVKNGYPGWPKIHNQLSRQLSRVSSFLREKGIQVEKGHSGQRFIEITNIALQAGNQARKQARIAAGKVATQKVTEGFKSADQAKKAVEETENQTSANKAHAETNTAFAEDFDI